MFPLTSLNARADLFNNASTTLFSVPGGETYTVLYESFNTGHNTAGASLVLSCGAIKTLQINDFARVDQVERFKFAKCSSDLVATVAGTSGNGTTTMQVIYVPYDLASSSTSTVQAIDNPNFAYLVVLAMIACGILLLDLFRRIFAKR